MKSVNGGSDAVTDINFNFYFSYSHSITFIIIIMSCKRQKRQRRQKSRFPPMKTQADELCATMNWLMYLWFVYFPVVAFNMH